MKRWNKLRKLPLALAGALLCSVMGCGGEDAVKTKGARQDASGSEEEAAQDVAKGRYVETQKTTPDGLKALEEMVRLSDGSVALLNPDKGSLLVSKDGGDSWEEKELPALAEKTGKEEIEITSECIAPDGAVFFSYVNWNEVGETGVNEKYVYINKDGSASEVELTEPSGNAFYLSWAAFTGERTLAALMNGGYAYTVSLDEGVLHKIGMSEDEYDQIFLAGDYLFTGNWAYQISTGKAAEDAELCEFIQQESPLGRYIALCYNEEEHTVYAASKSGLHSHVMGGGAMEELLDGGLCSLGDPTKRAAGILQNEDGSFLIGYEDGEIDHYAYDADIAAVPTQQISVFSMEQNMTVSRAVSIFRKSHPDVYVKQEIGLSGDYGVTKEDVIRNLNTKLLAGEGPDILLLDDMPLDSYVEKDILMDLNEAVEEMEEGSAYFSNVLRAYEKEDGLYAVPIRCRVPVILGKDDVIDGVSDTATLAGAVKKAREKTPNSNTVLGTYTPEELLKKLYMMLPASEFIKDGATDQEALKEFLAQAKAIYEEEKKQITDQDLQNHDRSIQWQEENGMATEEGEFPIDASAVMDSLSGGQEIVIGTISSVEDLEYAIGLLEHEDFKNASYELLSGERIFTPKGICGVNAKSSQMELSIEFFKALLGTEAQKADLSDGIPVNEDAFDKFFENPNPDDQSVLGFASSLAGDDGETQKQVHFEASWPDGDDVAALKEKVKMLAAPGLSDDMIRTAILESGAKALSGELSVDEGCGEIVQKVDLYLAE